MDGLIAAIVSCLAITYVAYKFGKELDQIRALLEGPRCKDCGCSVEQYEARCTRCFGINAKRSIRRVP